MGKRGPAPWEPTEQDRRNVEHYVSIGMTQEQIASVMGKSVDSLDRYCREELDNGALKVNAKIAARLYKEAMDGNVTSLIWWTKARMNWSEKVMLDANVNATVALKPGELPDALKFLAPDGEGQGGQPAAEPR